MPAVLSESDRATLATSQRLLRALTKVQGHRPEGRAPILTAYIRGNEVLIRGFQNVADAVVFMRSNDLDASNCISLERRSQQVIYFI